MLYSEFSRETEEKRGDWEAWPTFPHSWSSHLGGKGEILALQGDVFALFQHFIQNCFICRTSDSTVAEDAETSTLTVRRSNCSARSYIVKSRDMNFCYPDLMLQTKFVPVAVSFCQLRILFIPRKR
jgi:hypothetical protein